MDESGNTLWSTSFGSSPSQSIEFATTAYAKGKWAFIWRASIEKAAVTSLTESGTIEWTKYWVPGSHFWSPQFLGLQLIDGNEDGKLVVGADIEDYVLGYFPFIIARIQTTPETVYADTDGDGFGSALDSIVLTCGTIPSGYAAQKLTAMMVMPLFIQVLPKFATTSMTIATARQMITRLPRYRLPEMSQFAREAV